MECSKKQLITYTIINLVMLILVSVCVIAMDFNLLSLILSVFSIGTIFFSSISIWRHGKQYRR